AVRTAATGFQSSKNIMRVSRDLEAQQCCDACALQNPGSFIASRCITVDGLLVMRHGHLACALVSQREVGTTPSGSNGVLQHRPVAAWNLWRRCFRSVDTHVSLTPQIHTD